MSVCRFMYPFHRPSAGVVHVLEGGIPSESFGGGAGNARYARHAAGGTFTGKMLFEDGTVEVFFFVLRRVDREAPGGIRHFSVADGLGGHATGSHFGFRVEAHGNIEKLFVEERNATFHTPST